MCSGQLHWNLRYIPLTRKHSNNMNTLCHSIINYNNCHTVIIVTQARSTINVEPATSAKFGLHPGNIKFNIQE